VSSDSDLSSDEDFKFDEDESEDNSRHHSDRNFIENLLVSIIKALVN